MEFNVEIRRDAEWYLVRSKDMPGLFTQGRSLEEAAENARDALRLLIELGNDFGSGDVGVPSCPSGPPFLETSVELQLPENAQDE